MIQRQFSMANMRNGSFAFPEIGRIVGIAREISVTQTALPSPWRADSENGLQLRVFKALQNALLVLFVIFFAAVCCFISAAVSSLLLKGLEQIRANKAERTYSDIPKLTTFDFLSKRSETEAISNWNRK
ncbi:MAG: hypothetical protein ACLT0Y_07885 [Christensenellales bacterium]